MSTQSESGRETFAVKVKNRPLAVRCAWCKRWASFEDFLRGETGSPVTHGICSSCADRIEAQA